jgi:hypothetical protein
MQELGLGTGQFIDPPENGGATPDLADLDRLWTPIVSVAVRELFFASLRLNA